MFRMQVTGRRLDDVQTSDSHSLQLVSKLALFSCLTCTKLGFLQRSAGSPGVACLDRNQGDNCCSATSNMACCTKHKQDW